MRRPRTASPRVAQPAPPRPGVWPWCALGV